MANDNLIYTINISNEELEALLMMFNIGAKLVIKAYAEAKRHAADNHIYPAQIPQEYYDWGISLDKTQAFWDELKFKSKLKR